MTCEDLYVVKRSLLDLKNPAQPIYDIALPATFTDLQAAKQYTKHVLPKEGYDTKYFAVYDIKELASHWAHEDGVMVYAQGPSEEIVKVGIDTVPNLTGLQGKGSTGQITEPLYHVVQTVVEYDHDRSGSRRYSVVEGTYMSYEAAQKRALRVLLDGGIGKEQFVEYEEYGDGTEGPFGADVIVHAVFDGGLNALISVISSE